MLGFLVKFIKHVSSIIGIFSKCVTQEKHSIYNCILAKLFFSKTLFVYLLIIGKLPNEMMFCGAIMEVKALPAVQI